MICMRGRYIEVMANFWTIKLDKEKCNKRSLLTQSFIDFFFQLTILILCVRKEV